MYKKFSLFVVLSIFTVCAMSLTVAQAQDKITLRVWDTWTDGTRNSGMEKLVAAFEEANPGVKIVRDVQSIDEMRPIMRTALDSGTGPDILYYDSGPGFAGVLAEAGLIMPLTDAYETQGWDHIFEWTKDRTTFGGEVYGIVNELEFLGVYYNKDIFTELGVEQPQTYEEFLQICETAKAADYVPVAFGDANGWPAFHLFSIYTNNVLGKEGIENLLFNEGSWDTPEVAEAIRLFFVDLNGAGCLLPTPTAITYEDANPTFYNGVATMDITGTWLLSEILENADFEVGWFFLPSPNGNEPLPPAGAGGAFFISSATEHPEEAIAFLDFLYDPANAPIWMEDMNVIPPYAVDTSKLKLNPLMEFAVKALAENTMGYNIDVLTPPNFNTMMSDGFQAVLLGMKTPEEQAADLEAAMQESRAQK